MSTRPSIPAWHRTDRPGVSPDRGTVQRWLDACVTAWQAYDPALIADLWADASRA